jgi:hypothetical protein
MSTRTAGTGKKSVAPKANTKNAVLDMLDSKVVEASGSRRDFLKLFGFSVASAAVVSSCEKPVQKAIPYLIKPEEVVPGKASYYASTFYDGTEYCSVLVKVRDGRPIKIEGNQQSPVSRGGTSARVQASVLNLYDDARYKAPRVDGSATDWESVDSRMKERLSQGGRTVLLTPTVISPSTREVIRMFREPYPNAEWIQYDELSASGIRDAHREVFGEAVIPGYHFDKADYILSFGADFLGTWIAPVEFARDYAKTREVTAQHPHMSKHVQVEPGLSLTGSNADRRIPVTPAESTRMLGDIFNKVAAATGYAGYFSDPRCIGGGYAGIRSARSQGELSGAQRIQRSGCAKDGGRDQPHAGQLWHYPGLWMRTLQIKQGNDAAISKFYSELEVMDRSKTC